MNATEPQIVTHPELSIDPKPVIAPDAIQAAPAEAWARGQEFAVYKVPSRSLGTNRTVVYNAKIGVLYCDCEAGRLGGKVCAHLQSVLWKRAYEAAFRLYADLSLPELADRQRTFIEMERGALVEVRAYRALNAAIGDLVLARLEGAA